MTLPFIENDSVFHVGQLDPSDRAAQGKSSMEAFCVSVSEHPDDWRRIARLGAAPTWELSRPGAKWLDVLALSKEQEAEIAQWGIERGLARNADIWRAWLSDEEGAPFYLSCASEDLAEQEADAENDEDGPGPDGCYVDHIKGLCLTEDGMARLERWCDPMDGLGGLVILYAREVIDDPDVVGLWWNETHDPARLSCPRGAVLPEKLAEFSMTVISLAPDDDIPEL